MPDSRERDGSSLRGYLLTLTAAALWATGGVLAKWLMTASSPANADWPIPPLGLRVDAEALSGARALVSAVILLAYLSFRRRDALRVTRRDLGFFAVFGVFGLAGMHYTYFMAISLTSVATAILLQYLAPVIVLLVGVLALGHRFRWALPAGVALSVSGCALVVGVGSGSGLSISSRGLAWGLAAAVFFSLYSLLGDHAARRYSSYTTLVYGLSFAAVFWLVVLGPASVFGMLATPSVAAAILLMSVVSTILPFGAFLLALKYIPPTNALVASTVEPVIAGVGGLLLFGERFSPMQLFGGLLVIAAIVVVQSPWKRLPAALTAATDDGAPIFPPHD